MTPAPNLPATLAKLERAAIEGGMHLIHDGRHVKVSPIVPPGWFRIAGCVRDAYEETDRTAGCCDIDRIGGVAA